MADAGMRRDEVVHLKIGNIEGNMLRFRGKGGKERTVPMTGELKRLVAQFMAGRPRDASLVELGEKGVYSLVKRYGALAGMPEISPHDLRRAFGTRLLNVTGNIRIVQEILGHSNVNTTEAYTAVTNNNKEEAISSLYGLPGSTSNPEAGPAENKEKQNAGRKNGEDTEHVGKMRELARELANQIEIPSLWDRDLLRNLPVDFKAGQYYLPIGTVEIDRKTRIKVMYPEMGTGIAAPHLVATLFSHLSTAKADFAELTGNTGKLKDWVDAAGKYSQALLVLLKTIVDDVKQRRIEVSFQEEESPGLTKWFVITAWIDAIQNAGGNSWINEAWYKPYEQIPDTNLWRSRCGAYVIGMAENEEKLAVLESLHKKLRGVYTTHQLTLGIARQYRNLNVAAEEIRQKLKVFSDMAELPGHCELCEMQDHAKFVPD